MQNMAALAVRIMAHCHPKGRPPSEDEQQCIREAADNAARTITTAESQQHEKLQIISEVAHHLMVDGIGNPRDVGKSLNWWQLCHRAKQSVQRDYPGEFEEPIEDTCVKCKVRLARQLLCSQGKRRWSQSNYVRMVNQSINGDDQITVSWADDDQRRRYQAASREELGHKDISFYIWKEGLPKCCEDDINAADDYKYYTTQLVQWLWDFTNEIMGTKMNWALKRTQRHVDNSGLTRRLRCRVE